MERGGGKGVANNRKRKCEGGRGGEEQSTFSTVQYMEKGFYKEMKTTWG
jgi:hypothetical protein